MADSRTTGPRMTPAALPNSLTPEELWHALFAGRSLTGQLGLLPRLVEHWLVASKGFARFAQGYQSKIRKKIKICRDVDEAHNLACELYTAYLLLQEAKFAVAYEPLSKSQGRSADFAVTYSTHTLFHVEVTRMRSNVPELTESALRAATLDEQRVLVHRYVSRRLADVVCEKLGQFSPATPNVLCVWSEAELIQELDPAETIYALKARVEQRDPELYARHRFAKPADFIRPYQALSAMLVITQPFHYLSVDSQAVLSQPSPQRVWRWWQNKEARYPLPPKVSNLVQLRLTGEAT